MSLYIHKSKIKLRIAAILLCLISLIAIQDLHYIFHHDDHFTCSEDQDNHFHDSEEIDDCPVCILALRVFYLQASENLSTFTAPKDNLSGRLYVQYYPQTFNFSYPLRAPPRV